MPDIKKHKTGSMVQELAARYKIHVIALVDWETGNLSIKTAVPASDAVQTKLLKAIVAEFEKCNQKTVAKRG